MMLSAESFPHFIAVMEPDSFLAQGTRVGILIHPEQRWVEIRRTEQEPIALRDGDVLAVPDILPGWEVKVEDLWSPQFDELEGEE